MFLRHVPSALIPIITIPFAVLISFIPFRMMGLTANIMSLGGIAIAIGAMVDAAIVVVEQTHKKLEDWRRAGGQEAYRDVIINAVKEVAGPSFFALLVIAVAFLPVLTLEGQEGRLFKPLAYTKTLAMMVAAVLAITLDPALRLLFARLHEFHFRPVWLRALVNKVVVGTIQEEDRHPISRFLIRTYEPVLRWSLESKAIILGAVVVLVLATVPAFMKLGSEFMPPLEEGSLLYMPSTMPGISMTEAQKLLQATDRVIKSFPEVDRVLGKAGRAETATDPAPLSMFETVITLRPRSQWRTVDTWYSGWAPEWLKPLVRPLTTDRISQAQLVDQLNDALELPGLSNSWTMPVKGRIDMLTTGVRTPIGLKISGADAHVIGEIGAQVEAALARVRGTRSVFAERTGDGFFLDVEWKRDRLARYGVSVEQAQTVVASAIGGETVTTTVEGRARYPVSVRYMQDFRTDAAAIGRMLVPTGTGERQVSVAELANVTVATGPSMIRNEDGLTTGYVYVDLEGRDPGGYVAEADRVLRANVKLPAGYAYFWSGQDEAMQRVRERLTLVVPITLFLIFTLLYISTRSIAKTMIVAMAVPFSAIGAVWFLYLLGYNMSVAVWVGLDRAGRSGCRDRRFHAVVPGPRLRASAARGAAEHDCGVAAGHRERRRQAHPTQVHDRGDDLPGPRAHHVGHRRRLGCDEADCRAHDWRHLHLVPARAPRLSSHL